VSRSQRSTDNPTFTNLPIAASKDDQAQGLERAVSRPERVRGQYFNLANLCHTVRRRIANTDDDERIHWAGRYRRSTSSNLPLPNLIPHWSEPLPTHVTLELTSVDVSEAFDTAQNFIPIPNLPPRFSNSSTSIRANHFDDIYPGGLAVCSEPDTRLSDIACPLRIASLLWLTEWTKLPVSVLTYVHWPLIHSQC